MVHKKQKHRKGIAPQSPNLRRVALDGLRGYVQFNENTYTSQIVQNYEKTPKYFQAK